MAEDLRGIVVEEEGFFPDDDVDYRDSSAVATAAEPSGNLVDRVGGSENLVDPSAEATAIAGGAPTRTVSSEIAAQQNPDEAARAELDAQILGIPPPYSLNQELRVGMRHKAKAAEFVEVQNRNRGTPLGLALDDPALLSALDPVELPGLENIAFDLNLGGRIALKAEQGWTMASLGYLYATQAFGGTLNPQELAEQIKLDELHDKRLPPAAIDEAYEKLLLYGTEMTALLASTQPTAMGVGVLGGLAAAGVAAAVTPTGLGKILAAGGAAITVGGITYKAATGAQTAMMETGWAYKEYQKIEGPNGARLDNNTARGAAIIVGIANGAIEIGSVGPFIKATGLDSVIARFGRENIRNTLLKNPSFRRVAFSLGKRFAGGESVQIIQENLQEIVQMAGAEIAKALSEGEFHRLTLEEFTTTLMLITEKTFFGVAPVVGASVLVPTLQDIHNVKLQKQEQIFFGALNEQVGESKLRKRLPARFAELVDKLAEDGPVEEIYIDAEKLVELFQSEGGTLEDIHNALPSTRGRLEAAIASNAAINVPIGEFATNIAGTEAYGRLADHIKTTADGMTAAEMKAFESTYKEDLEREQQDALSRIEEIARSEEPADRVYQDIVQQMEAAGMRDVGAAALWRAYFKTMGERLGVDPYQLYEENRAVIEGPLQRLASEAQVTRLDLTLDRIRSGKPPKQRDVMGPTILEAISEAGGLKGLADTPIGSRLATWHLGRPFQKRVVTDVPATGRLKMKGGYREGAFAYTGDKFEIFVGQKAGKTDYTTDVSTRDAGSTTGFRFLMSRSFSTSAEAKEWGEEIAARDTKPTPEEGTDLEARDTKPTLEEGIDLDAATALAIEAGFLEEGATESDLLDAMEVELAGAPVFSDALQDPRLLEEMQDTEATRELLELLDLDVNELSNEEIKDIFEGVDRVVTPEGQVLLQRRRMPSRSKKTGQYKGAPEGIDTPQKLAGLRRVVKKLALEGAAGRFWYEQSTEAFLKIASGDVVVAEKLIQLAAIYSPQASIFPNTMQAIKAYNLWKNGVSREDFYVRPFGRKDEVDEVTGEIIKEGITLDTKAIALLYDGKSWDGRKTKSFYVNLMSELIARISPDEVASLDLDAALLAQINKTVTVDMWMRRAYGYKNDSVGIDKGKGAYSFVEEEIVDLAEILSEQLGTEILPHQVQAMIWTATKARFENAQVKTRTNKESVKQGFSTINEETGKWEAPKGAKNKKGNLRIWRKRALALDDEATATGVEEAKFDFADSLNLMTEYITWEAVPSPSLNHPINNAPPMEQLAFTVAARAIVTDTPWDKVSDLVGTPLVFFDDSFGGYKAGVAPNIVTGIVPTKQSGEYSTDEVRAYARFLQYVFKQNAVPWLRLDNTVSFERDYGVFKVVEGQRSEKALRRFSTFQEAKAYSEGLDYETQVAGNKFNRAVKLQFDSTLSRETQEAFYKVLRERLGYDSGFTRMEPDTILVVNFRDENGVPKELLDNDFIERIEEIARGENEKWAIIETVQIGVEGEYGPDHNWDTDPDGAALLDSDGIAGRPDLQNWAKDRRLVYEAILARARAGEFAQPRELYQEGVGLVSEEQDGQPARKSVAAPIPVDRLLDGGRSLADDVYGRFGSTSDEAAPQDITESLKLYDLTALIESPEIIEGLLEQFGYTPKVFSFEEDAERGVEFIVPTLGRLGYEAGNVWIYDPRNEHGSFKDVEYTRAWRITHEIGHAISERVMQQKYGDSRRYGRLGRTMTGERGKPPKRIEVELEPLTLMEAQRAVEWEDVAFRAQRMLLERLGVVIDDATFAKEYNINISDAVYRILSGDFGNPGELGFVPNSQIPNLRDALMLLQNVESELAQEQGREPTAGINLKSWRRIADSNLSTDVQLRRIGQDPERPADTAMLRENDYQFDDATQSVLFESDRTAQVPSKSTVLRVADKGMKEIIERNIKIKKGRKVGVRLNLPTLNRTGVAVQTLHDENVDGKTLTYQGVVRLTNATFEVDQGAREAIALGQKPKNPMASINGEYQGTTKNFTGIEVFFDPKREHLMRDGFGRPIRFAEDVTIVGTRAFVRGRVEYFSEETAPVRPQTFEEIEAEGKEKGLSKEEIEALQKAGVEERAASAVEFFQMGQFPKPRYGDISQFATFEKDEMPVSYAMNPTAAEYLDIKEEALDIDKEKWPGFGGFEDVREPSEQFGSPPEKLGELRALYDPATNNFYVFVASQAMHNDLAEALGIDYVNTYDGYVHENIVTWGGSGAPGLPGRPEFAGRRSVDIGEYLTQPEEQVALQQRGARGSILFPTDATQPSIIRIFESWDLSTFLHESGHFFLETTRRLALGEAATPELRNEWEIISKWLGVAPGEDLTVEHHEKWAETFEAYLREGKAPSAELRSVFAKFRAWLLDLYNQIKKIGTRVQLDDTITAIFDRMLASEEAIAAAEESTGATPHVQEFARALGLSEAEMSKLLALEIEAREEALKEVEERVLAETTREYNRKLKEERARLLPEVTAEIDEMPVYQALHIIRNGINAEEPPLWLSRESLVRIFGGREILRRLPGAGASLLYRRKGGVDADFVASLVNYDSGEAMVLDIINSPSRKEAIETEVERRARSTVGDKMNDGTLARDAQEALHNNKRARLLKRELELLRNKSGDALRVPPAKVTREIARKLIAETSIKDIKEHVFITAERRAGRAANRAIAKKEWAEAARQKRIQLLNFELAREARIANDAVEAGIRRVRRLNKASSRKNIDIDYRDQIDALLDRFDFRRISNKALERKVSLAEWVITQQDKGYEIDINDKLLNEAMRRSYKLLSYEEFTGLMDALANIEYVGRRKNKLIREARERDFRVIVNRLVASAKENATWKTPKPLLGETAMDNAHDQLERVHASQYKPEFAFVDLDHPTADSPGEWYDAIFKPFSDAENAEFLMMKEITEKLNKLFKLYSLKEKEMWFMSRKYFAGIGRSLNRNEIISVALNWGNMGNREALMAGYGWTEENVLEILDALNERDWEFVQGIWDTVNSLWPDISALQRRLSGVVPAKVEATPIETKYGTMRGGYYPLKYDPRQSYKAAQREEAQTLREQFGGNATRAATRQGHTKERVGSGGQPVWLDLSVITRHFSEVVHDLSYREAVFDVDRILQNEQVREAIESTLGRSFYRTLRPWIQNIAAGTHFPTTPFENFLTHTRHGATIMSMGYKFTTMLVQFMGFTQSIELLGPRWAAHGVISFYGNPLEMANKVKFVLERSVFMQNRTKNFDRDVRDVQNRLGTGGTFSPIKGTFLAGIGIMDMSVSLPTWLGAYGKALNESNDEARAIQHADSAVRRSQGAGGPKDLANIQYGPELLRLFTMFYSYFSSLYGMQTRAVKRVHSVADIPRLVMAMLLLIVIPATLTELMLDRGPDEDEDPLWWTFKKTGAYPFLSVILLRDIVSAMESGYGYRLSPVAGVFDSMVNAARGLGKAAGEDEVTRSTIKNAWLATSTWLKLPGRQIALTTEYLYDWMNGDVDGFNIYEALVTGDKDK